MSKKKTQPKEVKVNKEEVLSTKGVQDNKKEKVKELRLKQENFCQLYVNGTKELFGNGTQCYIEAYEPDQTKPNWYKTARSSANQILTSINVINRINELLNEEGSGGYNDANVTRQHLFNINQFADLGVKQRSIDSYFKVKGKFNDQLPPPPEAPVIINGVTVHNMSTEQIMAFLREKVAKSKEKK